LKKKSMTSARRRLIVNELRESFGVPQRRAARALDLSRSGLRYTPVISDEETALARRIEQLAGHHPRFGYRRVWAVLNREGWSVNKKAVRRHWRRLGLKLARKPSNPKPRRPHGQDANACHLRPSRGKDDVWTWDFIFDRTSDGLSLKWLSLVDEYTRECLALEARRGMTAEEIRVILAEVATRRGGPLHRVRSDHGPEFAADVVRSWLEETGSGPLYVAAGSPWQNGYAESFHSKLRDEFLDREEFESQVQAQALGTLWKEEYNTERPHSSLRYQTPAEYAGTCVRYMPIDEMPTEVPSDEQPHP
jgi:putative transposase